MARIHVIGGGLAGLAAAVECAVAGRAVTLYEAAGHAGGRCRSFYDEKIDAVIDNGNHLLLSGNRAARAYLRRIGARDRVAGPDRAVFPFIDLGTGERWELRPGDGWLPLWIFDPRRRVPGTRAR
ncbi:MAG: FAD-dependent oxidoreductase, partial [Alphaproteobacteria bacterium]